MAKKKGSKKNSPKTRNTTPKKPRAKASTSARSKRFESFLAFPSFPSESDDLLKKIFQGLAAFMLLTMVVLSQGVGMNADEKMQNEYEQKLMAYYSTGGKDKGALDLPKTKMHLYGGFYEVVSGATNKILGSSDPYNRTYHKVRHFWVAIFGFFTILFVGLTAKELAGWQAGILAMIFLYLSPRFLGHSLMNPKDIPFAMGYIMSLYYFILTLKELPTVNWKNMLGLAFGIGVAIGVRAGGLLVVAIIGLFGAIHFFMKYGFKSLFTPVTLKYLQAVALPVLGGLIIAILFWPYALQSPVKNIMESLAELSAYSIDIRLLFAGKTTYAQNIPNSYLPTWVAFTVPFFILIGLLLFIGLSGKLLKKYASLPILMLIFGFVFPFVYIVYQGSTLYDGWRHLIFPYTCGVILAALAWNYLFDIFKGNKMATYGLIGVLTLCALDPALFVIKNTHYPYVYFNALAGGISGAYGNYETDYWGTSIKQSVDWLEEEGIISENMKDTVRIATNFHYQLDRYLGKKYGKHVVPVYVRYRERYKRRWDYGVFLSRYMDGEILKAGHWPGSKTVHTIDASGVLGGSIPLVAIEKNEDRNAYLGQKAVTEKRWLDAIPLLTQEVSKHPDNETAWLGLVNAYMNTQQISKMKESIDNCRKVDPFNMQALNLEALYYLRMYPNREEGVDKAVAIMELAIDHNIKNTFAHYNLAAIKESRAAQNKALLEEAMQHMESFDLYNGQGAQNYDLGIRIAQLLKDGAREKYFTAKKAYMNKDGATAYRIVQEALRINKEYEPAVKMKEQLDKAIAEQQKKK